ncbi:unnamed protein product [Callosobruchus maculatus]|uniref:Uncharacterized protein n=1 Tax=Callosobruchus maculatus TaxID=64391 RepID=A0A653CPC8_CALMS|nr:unnamed protein product [Callosobruchus maculatus]
MTKCLLHTTLCADKLINICAGRLLGQNGKLFMHIGERRASYSNDGE